MAIENGLSWDDPSLRVGNDSDWKAGCRLLQTWWRQEVLELAGYGPLHRPKPDATEQKEWPLVGSILALNAPPVSNFLDPIILDEVELRLRQKGWGGIVGEDRLRRNLLSSQPVAFNLFGYLKHHPRALIAWLATLGIEATDIEVRIEWAPPKNEHYGGGSALDAAVFYTTPAGIKGVVGVEAKYSENLDDQTIDPRPAYLDATRTNTYWRTGASDRLREPRLTQLWLNTLLAQSCLDKAAEGVSEAMVVTMACAADEKALRATADVRAELHEPEKWLTWSPFEAVLEAVHDHDEVADWAERFRRRYLDFTPVLDHLGEGDLRRTANPASDAHDTASSELADALINTRMMAERVLGEESVLDQIATATPHPPAVEVLTLARQLEELAETMRAMRADAYGTWATSNDDI